MKVQTHGYNPPTVAQATNQTDIHLSVEASTTGDHIIVTISDWSDVTKVKHTSIRLDALTADFIAGSMRRQAETIAGVQS